MGFSVVEWHKETNGKNVLECPQDSSLVEANKWITAAREDFGICGYFVAYKWSFEIHNNFHIFMGAGCLLWECTKFTQNTDEIKEKRLSIRINCAKLL